ncbi:RNA methyltransferase [Mycoplasmatota bacterium]|nr:RNA methyltransferase [Mycoplasmatota bacterium]
MIKSLTNNKIKYINSLNNKKNRLKEKKFLVEGFHLVEEAKSSGALLEVLCTENYDFENVTIVTKEIIDKISKSLSPQKIIGVCKITEIKNDSNRILILDDISDPGNLGTLIRSAVGFGFSKIIVSKDTCDIYNDKVLRSTQGAIFKVEIIKGDLLTEIAKLNGYNILGSALNGKGLSNHTVDGKIAIILGNESRGISKEILNICDDVVFIETDTIESLNVATAGSILMYVFRI